jgi:hypothetical protein
MKIVTTETAPSIFAFGANTATALIIASAFAPSRQTRRLVFGRIRYVCQPETGQRHAGQANAEFLKRLPPGF